MKIRIEMDDGFEDEVVIRCKSITPDIIRLQQMISDVGTQAAQLTLYKGNTEYYIDPKHIIFFETEGSIVSAHTVDDIFETKMKLYELEELLGKSFQRVSKSTIANVNEIYSISRNLYASSVVEFRNTHKQIYVSRNYYKALKERIEEKR